MPVTSLEMMTLNCWGIPGPWPIGSKDRKVRIDAVADYLLKNTFDIVTLQEIWSTDDYDLIKRRVANVLPYSHYFYSGFLGSGVCVFTKGKIVEVLIHRYSLNGYAHHVHRGDWFGGKVVGLTRIRFEGSDKIINFYATHVHAEYNRANDAYLPHRLVQSLELSQFVNATSLASDLVFVAGDLNLEGNDLGYRVITSNAHLKDAWLTRESPVDDLDSNGFTCDVASNCYTSPLATPKRIDYILYKHHPTYDVVVDECKTLMGRIADIPSLNYSDHEAVYAKFSFREPKEGDTEFSAADVEGERSDLIEARNLMDKEMVSVHRARKVYTSFAVALMVILFLTLNLELHFPRPVFIVMAIITRFFVTLMIGFCLWFGVIVLKTEENAFQEAKEEVNVLLQ